MSLSSLQTLIVFLCIFGIIGASRGPGREVWTMGGIVLTALLLLFGGTPVFEQLPLRIAAAVMSLAGNQNGSNSMAAHPLGEPWTTLMLWLVVGCLIILSYAIGQRFGTSKTDSFGAVIAGFVMGAINGLVIAVFVFQNGLSSLSIQFPDGLLTRSIILPIIMVGVGLAVIAVATRKQTKPAAK